MTINLNFDGMNHVSVHTKTHFSILIANNGPVFRWEARPRKIIQNLAPNFHEVERNIHYAPPKQETQQEDKEMTDEAVEELFTPTINGLMDLDKE